MRGHVSHLALCLLQIRLPRAGADVSRSCLAHPRHFGADDAGDGLGSFGAGVPEARGGGGNNRFFFDCDLWGFVGCDLVGFRRLRFHGN